MIQLWCFAELQDYFPEKIHHFIFPPAKRMEVLIFLHPLPHFIIFLNVATLIYVKWHLIGVFICILLTANDVEHISCVYWSSEYHFLEKNVYSDLLPRQMVPNLIIVWLTIVLLYYGAKVISIQCAPWLEMVWLTWSALT